MSQMGRFAAGAMLPDVETLTGDNAVAVGPTAGNINVVGGNNITTTGTLLTSTLSIAVTGTTDHAVQIGNATGSLTSLAVGATGEGIMGSTAADPFWTGSPSFSGLVTAGTGFTATTGNIRASSGNIWAFSLSNDAVGADISVNKSRLGGILTSGDEFGSFDFYGHDGTAYILGASIIGKSTGTIGLNRMPSQMEFYTHPDAVGVPLLRTILSEEGVFLHYESDIGAGWSSQNNLVAFFGSYIKNDALGSYAGFHKGRGSSLGIITSGDELGGINFAGADGANSIPSASITAVSTGTIGLNRIPSILRFYTHQDAVVGVPTLRMSINEAGTVTIQAPNAGNAVDVVGSHVSIAAGNLLLPSTNTAGTEGVIEINGTRFMHDYGDITNTFLGHEAGNFTHTKDYSTGIGYHALYSLDVAAAGDFNVAVGSGAGRLLTSGGLNTIVGHAAMNNATTAAENVSIGTNTMTLLTTGSHNIAIGGGIYQTAPNIKGPLYQLLTGTNNIAIGAGTSAWNTGPGYNYTDAESNNILIGGMTLGTLGESNTMRLGTTGAGEGQVNRCFIAGAYNVAVGATYGIATIDNADQLGSIASVPASHGGTGATSITDHSLIVGSGTAAVTELGVAINGQIPIGSAAADPVLANITSSDGSILITNGAGSIDLAMHGAGWNNVTTATQAMAVDAFYIANRVAGIVTFTLPATIAVGEMAVVAGSQNGWSIAQNAGQTIHFLGSDTTTGIGGSLASTTRYDCVTLLCIVANSDFVVMTAVGNLTVT